MKTEKTKEVVDEELPEFYYHTILPEKRGFYKEKGKKVSWLNTSEYIGNMDFSIDGKRVFSMWKDYPWKLTREEKEVFDRDEPFWANFHKGKCEGWECIEEHPPFKRKYYRRGQGEKIFWANTEDYVLDIDEFSFDKKKIYNLYRDYPWELTIEEKEIFDSENPFSAQELYFRNFLERSKVRGKWVYRLKGLSDLVSGMTEEEKEVTYKKHFDCLKKTALDHYEYAEVNDLILEKDGVVKLKKDFLRF